MDLKQRKNKQTVAFSIAKLIPNSVGFLYLDTLSLYELHVLANFTWLLLFNKFNFNMRKKNHIHLS